MNQQRRRSGQTKGYGHESPGVWLVALTYHAQIDMDKLADNLQRLQEDDLLQVVQMVHDHKTAESYTKNDIDGTATTLLYQIR